MTPETAFLNKKLPIVRALFSKSECHSLRVLRQVLNDAIRFESLFDSKQINNEEKFNALFQLFIATDIEVKSGNLERKDLSDRLKQYVVNHVRKDKKDVSTEAENKFLISRAKFENFVEMESSILGDTQLIEMTVDGIYSEVSVQDHLASILFFAEPLEQPAWLRFMNFRTNSNEVVDTAAIEMDKQFVDRSCDDLGEFLHIVS